MFGFGGKKKKESQQGQLNFLRTNSADIDSVAGEIYRRVVDNCLFCLGVVSTEKGMLGQGVKYRMNQEFSAPAAVDYVRRKLKPAQFGNLFGGISGMAQIRGMNLYRVQNPDSGLPVNSVIALIEGANSNARAIVIFGGERLEGKLESKLSILESVLGKNESVRQAEVQKAQGPSLQELLTELKSINPKRLFDYELNVLSKLVHELEQHKDSIPKPFRPKYSALNSFLLKRQLGEKTVLRR